MKTDKSRYDIIAGIDPDSDKSGIAELHPATRKMETASLRFPYLVDYLAHLVKRQEEEKLRIRVAVEAGWLNQSHWHLSGKDTTRSAAAKGNAVGRNHETGRKIVEMSRHMGLDVVEIRPLPLRLGAVSVWGGRDGKITAEEFKALTGHAGRTNQEERDAALIAWVEAGLPMRINSMPDGKG